MGWVGIELRPARANVAYELGLMQSLGKRCVILLSSRFVRPTDLQGLENVRARYCQTDRVGRAIFREVKGR